MKEIRYQFPLLGTERTKLTEITNTYKKDLFELFTDSRVTAFFPVINLKEEDDILPVIALFKQNFDTRTSIRWGIKLRESDQLIGTIGYTNFTAGHRGSLVYALKPEYWGKGLMSEALAEIIRFGFQELDINRIEAETRPGNTSSEKLLHQCGFQFEGLLKEWMLWNGQKYDIRMHALLQRDFQKLNQTIFR